MKKLLLLIFCVVTTVAQTMGNQQDVHNQQLKLAECYNKKAKDLSAGGDDSLAILFYKKALELYNLAGDESAAAGVNHNMGISYYNRSDYYTALELQEKALASFQKLKKPVKESESINSIGVIYMSLANYTEALKNFFKSLKIAEQQNDKTAMATANMNIGLIYENMHLGDKALEYHFKALQLAEKLQDNKLIAHCYNNMANAYSYMENFKMALTCYQKAFAINEQINSKFGVASNLTNIGINYYQTGHYSMAMEYLEKSVPVYVELGDKDNLALTYEYIGMIWFVAPDSVFKTSKVLPSERQNKALEYYSMSLGIFKQVSDIAGEADVHQCLSELYEKRKNYAESLSHYKSYIELRDSVINDGKKGDIIKQEMKFEFEKKEALAAAEHEKQKALAGAELKNQKFRNKAMMAGVIMLLLSGAGGFIGYKRRRDTLQLKKDAELQAEITDTEMKALRAQMNPHFVFNSLNAINDFIDANDKQSATYFTTKFAKLMRMILENSEKKEISVADDLQALNLYMQLEAMRLKNKFSFEIVVDDEIDAEVTLIPPLILQPFVENSIWHGIAKKDGEGHIRIEVSKNEGMILCTVTDNGIGRKTSAAIKHDEDSSEKKSVGMKITQARIDLLNKLKKANAKLKLTDLEQGLRIDISLPFQTRF